MWIRDADGQVSLFDPALPCGKTSSAPSPEEPHLHVIRPEKGRWQYTGAVLGDRSSLAWTTWNAEYFGVPQTRRRIFLVADFAGYSPISILFKQESLSGDPEADRETEEASAAGA